MLETRSLPRAGLLVLGLGSTLVGCTREEAHESVVVPTLSTLDRDSHGELAREIAEQTTRLIDDIPGFSAIDWAELLALSTLDEAQREVVGCIVGRQLAVAHGVDVVVCSTLEVGSDGTLTVESVVVRPVPGEATDLSTVVGADPAEVATELAAVFRGWATSLQ